MNDSSDPSDRIETGMNNPGDRNDHDHHDRTLFYSSDPLAIATIQITGVAHSNPTDRKDRIESSLNFPVSFLHDNSLLSDPKKLFNV